MKAGRAGACTAAAASSRPESVIVAPLFNRGNLNRTACSNLGSAESRQLDSAAAEQSTALPAIADHVISGAAAVGPRFDVASRDARGQAMVALVFVPPAERRLEIGR